MNRAFRVLLLAMFLPACERRDEPAASPDPMAAAKPPTAQEISTFSQRTGFTIPATARGLRFFSQTGGMDDSFAIAFALPSAEFQQFVSTLPLPTSAIRRGETAASTPIYLRAWLPSTPKNFHYANTFIAPGRAVQCVFDFDDPQTTIVYLKWFET